MKDEEKVLGNIFKELKELEKLELKETERENIFTSGAGLLTFCCCGY